ncbi:MAG: hypothetical protein RBG13Loki_2125 [Promethearchaeota archaeon CR_4]|nr:MAG: hypothetical protein RBG13Loki_2125 [Candidatus Lokiarchaeota archaeon CR_4]
MILFNIETFRTVWDILCQQLAVMIPAENEVIKENYEY